MVAAAHGEVLAAVCFEVVQTRWERGPSTVLRVVDDAGMLRTMRAVVKRLGVSGFCGFDFVVDQATGTPLVIEMNARPTQLVHCPLGPGKDLVAAYVRGVLGMNVADREAVTTKPLIALFPQEVERDPKSPWLAEAYHDVPWNEPKLIERALRDGKVSVDALRETFQ
jgi:hypothetical protein